MQSSYKPYDQAPNMGWQDFPITTPSLQLICFSTVKQITTYQFYFAFLSCIFSLIHHWILGSVFHPVTHSKCSAKLSSFWHLSTNQELHVIGSHVKLLEVVSCGWLVADWYLLGWSRCRCNLVSQCVGASDLWPPCLSVELPFDCFIPSRALESMLMSKVLIYHSIRG